MLPLAALLSLGLSTGVSAQQAGTLTAETHPPITIQECSAGGTCSSVSASVTLDGNWRWTHDVKSSTNCYTGNQWDTTLCPDPVTCATNCALDGANYEGTYGITASGDSLKLAYVTGANVGSRVYLMDEKDEKYRLFQLKNQEFTFDVDVSNLPCGLNGALYMVAMDADGGSSEYTGNKAGSKYGTGYCDTQCPHDIKFIAGEANTLNWTATNANSGTGTYGSCCIEMDIWEANSVSNALTPHSCNVQGQTRCSGIECGDTDSGDRYDGICDKDGCDFNPYRMGSTSFFGDGLTVDTSKVVTVVTQFITDDNTSTGQLSEIRRFYVQDGVVIANAASTNLPTNSNSITDDYCNIQKTAFGDTNTFESLGGLAAVGDALETGMVLVLSLWDDTAVDMLWLDSDYPTTANPATPGVARGTCAITSGDATTERSQFPNSSVTFSNIKYGPIGSTFASRSIGTTSSSSVSSTSTSTKASFSKVSSSKTSSVFTTSTKATSTASTSPKATTTTTSSKSATNTPHSSKSATTTSHSSSSTKFISTSTSPSSSATSACSNVPWGQCGGQTYTGPTCCPSGWSCQNPDNNIWYSQCLEETTTDVASDHC